jgi:hypothetical protein
VRATADGKTEHREPYVQLVDVTRDSALVAWGHFDLVGDEHGWRSESVPETIGMRAPALGHAVVEVLDDDDRVVAREATDDANHLWVGELRPATTYRYRVLVDGEPWGGGERYDWSPDGLRPASRAPGLMLRTHPEADRPDPITFLAVGDFGVGLNSPNGPHQLGVARTMQRLADAYDVRCIVGLGDTIYHGPGGPDDHSGADDDDWWLAFFQPYRYLLDHLPFYPTAGNHDGADEEAADDRAQLEDNLYLSARFRPRAEVGRASLDPGLFYRLELGSLLELICIDSTQADDAPGRAFDDPRHHQWIEEALTTGDARWRIPFSHHPVWCAGPDHSGMQEQVDRLVPLYRKGGVRLLLHGHEHNFQHGQVDGLDHIITGAGGKVDHRTPVAFEEAGTCSWAAEPHCLLIQVAEDHLTVVPFGATPPGGQPQPLVRQDRSGAPVDGPITLHWDHPGDHLV